MESPAQEAVAQPSVKWQPLHIFAFRWIFSYFAFYYLPHPPTLCKPAIVWLGHNVLHLGYEIPTKFNGSGDTTYHWLMLLCNLVLASLAAIVWSLLDRRRENYHKLEQWLKLVLRLSLGHTMLTYGASKVFEGQFPQPGPDRLCETFGEASPMGLLWTFMGASRPYSIIAGLAEMIPGLLLFFPPVAALGAVICSAVMFHIFALNLCYDVPVKIYSCQLFLTAVYLSFPAIKRLAEFFILNDNVKPLPAVALFKQEAWNKLALALQVFLGVVLAGNALWGSSCRAERDYREEIAAIPMYGVWQVDSCLPYSAETGSVGGGGTSGSAAGGGGGATMSENVGTSSPWYKLIFEYPGTVTVHLADGKRKYYGVSVDQPNHKFILSSHRDPEWQRVFTMIEVSPNVVNMESNASGVPGHMKIHRIDESTFLLKSRGFHWINEYPFNR